SGACSFRTEKSSGTTGRNARANLVLAYIFFTGARIAFHNAESRVSTPWGEMICGNGISFRASNRPKNFEIFSHRDQPRFVVQIVCENMSRPSEPLLTPD